MDSPTNVNEHKDMDNKESPDHRSSTHDHNDFSIKEIPREIVHGFVSVVKGLDTNRYATKKTIAQGMLDLALLTANAAQLKYFLTEGRGDQFYTLMVSLICTSLVLQVVQAVMYVMLGTCYDLNKESHQKGANFWNNVLLALNLVTVAVNVVINVFEMSTGAGKVNNTEREKLLQNGN